MRDGGVSVVLGSYDRRPFLKAAIDSVRDSGISVPFEIIVVDGGSTDGSLEYLVQQKDIVTVVQHNRGRWGGKPIAPRSWGSFMNLVFKAARGKFICMISDDSLLMPGAIMSGVDTYNRASANGRKIGGVAFYWREWPDSSAYWVGLTFGGRMIVNHGLFLRHAVEEVGWLDEDRYSFYHADGDLALRLWEAGYEVIDCPQAFVEHYRHAGQRARKSNVATAEQDWRAYEEKWGYLGGDIDNEDQHAMTLHFDDPHRTACNFPRADVVRYKIAKVFKDSARHLLSLGTKS